MQHSKIRLVLLQYLSGFGEKGKGEREKGKGEREKGKGEREKGKGERERKNLEPFPFKLFPKNRRSRHAVGIAHK
ncbi:hypothetical protein VF04_28655 [Nostoc linckia z7]|uniref:Uncharacterized protein n=2 Tax=Nostoc linckia TaxID=92942 RepID=A0A9Q6EIX1_NOSLI|nr:hypothetical protein VF02_26830 [Nostoc linckia z1]PHJ60176.1 hypothetical protein VF03_33690 [Nostoc linckia z2]PHJ64056.1 hypothetical protein VF05_23685 [Nostoc linckia z3]PHJ74931.1 hypothetical protein VF06_33935 [Nostoc linckia z4]PHJ78835.1 hypothetical protein VF07_34950 [Nostoc linckia z6]PHJ92106.1 hypothetical protein VF04_28655 [Nostoc linckia z7]PHJ98600.1 hypothetical protein VF08_26690 [Nostoc linckia z8]PHK07169.1 hypothetical protein VF09_24235 [Nostoc linckia z9]PHK0800